MSGKVCLSHFLRLSRLQRCPESPWQQPGHSLVSGECTCVQQTMTDPVEGIKDWSLLTFLSLC